MQHDNNNTAVGYRALIANGDQVLIANGNANARGTGVIAIGHNGLMNNMQAGHNTALGYRAGLNNTTKDTAVIGVGSDSAPHTHGNVIIGPLNYVDGNNNVIIGSGNKVYGSGNIVIGSDLEVHGDNQYVVANASFGRDILYDIALVNKLAMFKSATLDILPEDIILYICKTVYDIRMTHIDSLVYCTSIIRNSVMDMYRR